MCAPQKRPARTLDYTPASKSYRRKLYSRTRTPTSIMYSSSRMVAAVAAGLLLWPDVGNKNDVFCQMARATALLCDSVPFGAYSPHTRRACAAAGSRTHRNLGEDIYTGSRALYSTRNEIDGDSSEKRLI